MKALLTLTLLLSSSLWAHGDHHEPGAMPPAPNGGVIKESRHHGVSKGHQHKSKKGHDDKGSYEKKIFFEVTLKKGILKVFPLELDPKTHASFNIIPQIDFSKTTIWLRDPRKKKTYKPTIVKEANHWQANISKIRGRRFIVNVSSNIKKDNFKAKIQVERK